MNRDEIKQYLTDLKNGDIKSRAIAAYMLGTAGKKDESIKIALKKALKDKNFEVRKWAALSLGEMGEKESRLVPILIDVLKRDDSKEFRTHAAIILGELEKKAIPALPALYQASQDDNTRISEWACWALNKIIGEIPCNKPSYPEERPSLSERIRVVRKDDLK